MGLAIVSEDLRKDAWKGAYSAFAYYRGALGVLFGMQNYARYFGFLETSDFNRRKDYYKHLADAECNRLFEHRPDLKCFFAHSDCEGKWTPTECEAVISLLKEVKCKLPIEDHPRHIGNWTKTTKKFIEGIQYCVSTNQNAIFCSYIRF